MPDTTHFQYCQKLVVLSQDLDEVLLARRKGEADYDGVFSFIGGKMEMTDESLLAGMKREKDEEIGVSAKIFVLPNETYNLLFRKKDGNAMVLPHVPARYIDGEIMLNEEYDTYEWVSLDELDVFEPKIDNITQLSLWAQQKIVNNKVHLVEL